MMKPKPLEQMRAILGQLSRRVLGQTEAISIVAALGRHWLAGLLELAPRILLLGPTGVGKTECALALAEALTGQAPTRIDMSEHQLQPSVEVLLGNRTGDPGLLRQLLGGSPRTVLLCDEIEKAHPRVLDLLLQMLEPGHITIAEGIQIDLTAIPMVCTSNLATAALTDVQQLSAQALEDHVLEQVRRELRPEWLNRFSAIVVFQPLDVSAQEMVLRLQLNQYLLWLNTQACQIQSSPEAEQFLMLKGFDQQWGARSLRRTIRFHIAEAIVEAMFHGKSGSGQLFVEQQQLVLRTFPG